MRSRSTFIGLGSKVLVMTLGLCGFVAPGAEAAIDQHAWHLMESSAYMP